MSAALVGSSLKKLHSKSFSQQRRHLHDVVIVSALRTPIGSIGGELASLTAPKLGSHVIKAVVDQGLGGDGKIVGEVYMGNVLSAGIGQAPSRQATLGSGLPKSVISTDVNKVCASGMKAVMLGSQSIMLGHQDVIIAGGMESMSNTPFYLDKARYGYKYGHGKVEDGILKDGLWDPHYDFHMGNCGEACAKKYNITREEQDKFAIEAYRRAAEATKNGSFKNEIVPITVGGKKGEGKVVSEDEEYKNIKMDKVSTLKPAFAKDGTITAANASKLNDGAAALLLMSAERAKQLGVKPLAKVIGFADAALDPIDFTIAPATAIPRALSMAKIDAKKVDFYEINQAFSVVSLANMKLLNLDPAKVDVNGGGVSLGHPIGCSGARIIVTLLHTLKQRNGKFGVAGICNGGGGASAIVIENLS